MKPRTASHPRSGHFRRLAGWRAAGERKFERLSKRVAAARERHRSVALVFAMVERDSDIGGRIIAGALAYRLFIWLLPLGLVAVSGLGIAADASSQSTKSAARSLGVAGLVSSSVAGAAHSSGRWYALIVGTSLLIVATRGVLTVLIGAHRLVWRDGRASSPRATVGASVRALGLLLCLFVVLALGSAARAWALVPGIVVTVIAVVPLAGLWLLVTLRLPRRDAPWTVLVPGALLFGFGATVMHVVAAYVLVPYALAKAGTYGALGSAAALLLLLFLISRLAVSAAVVDVALWEQPAAFRSTRAG